jgi:hypothetical protein
MFDGITSAVGNVTKSIGDAFSPISGLAGTVGAYLGTQSTNQLQQQLQTQAQQFNAAQTQQQMDFQKQMRSTQYQTAVEDLKAAGLNPMLAYTQGGAGTPSGAAASSPTPPQMHNALQNAVHGAQAGAQAANTIKQNQLIDAQIMETDERSNNLMADTANKLDENPYIKGKYGNQIADTLVKNTIARMNTALAAHSELTIPKSQAEGKYYKTFGYGPFALRDIGSAANSAASIFGKLK